MEDNKKDKQREQEKQAKEEQAINHRATEGKQINEQVQDRREQHQPRDNA